jgi:hypothetical protein
MISYKLKYILLLIVFNASGCSAQEGQLIKVVNDNQYEGLYYLNTKGLITKFVYQDSTHSRDIILTYSYTETGSIGKINYDGGNNDDFFEEEIEKKNMSDAIYRTAFLEKKGIQFPLSFINSSELGDMANVFSVKDKYQTRVKGLEKFILFDSLNLKISFRSSIEKYIPHLTLINRYKVTLNGKNLANEEFVFEGGILVRSYSYDKQGRLMSIVWTCVYDGDPKKYSEIKKFSYVDGE